MNESINQLNDPSIHGSIEQWISRTTINPSVDRFYNQSITEVNPVKQYCSVHSTPEEVKIKGSTLTHQMFSVQSPVILIFVEHKAGVFRFPGLKSVFEKQ